MFPINHLDRKPLGSTKESISAIGIGTYGIRSERRAIEALKYAAEVGLDLVDTAEMYSSGRAEELIGEVLREVGRSKLFVITKLYPHRFRSPEESIKALKASLRRLGTSHVDLVLIHWPDPSISIEQQIRSLEALADSGLSRYIGVSNFTAEQLKKALVSTSKHDIVVNQVKYSIIDRGVERDLLPLCIESKVTLVAYTPLERGRVVNITWLNEMALKYNKTPIQVALNFLISRPNVVAIPKTEKKERVEEFKGALGWRLSNQHIEILEESSL